MSRTDVHRPMWVQERDHSMRRMFVEQHDHRDGKCDLDVFLQRRRQWVRTTCRLTYIGRRNIYCGCLLCTGQADRKRDRRRERAAARAQCRKARVSGEE